MTTISASILFAENQSPYISQQLNNEKSNPGIQIINPKTILKPYSVPGTFSFSVVLSVYGIEEKKGYKLNFTMTSPHKEKVVNVNIPRLEVDYHNVDPDVPLKFKGVNIGINIQNALFKERGVYCCTISIDSENVGKTEVFVSPISKNS